MSPSHPRQRPAETTGGVFYLHGADEHRKEEAARSLVEAHLEDGTRDFNYDRLRGSEVGVERLASTLGTPPMMAEWRVVVLRETQALASSPRARAILLEAAASPPPGLALILLCTEPSRARFYQDLKKSAQAREFSIPDVNDLPVWLMEWCREHHQREMEEDAARALAQAVGADMGILAQEVAKLATFVEAGETVTREIVEAGGTRIPEQDRWKWFDLVGEGKFQEALLGLPILLQHGENGVGLTLGLGTHLLRLGVVVDAGPKALESLLPGRQRWLARRYVQQARHWSADQIEDALSGLLEVDRLLKASSMADEHFLEQWLLARIVARGVAA